MPSREDDASPASERDETPAERDDRLWDDLLQELRVVQTGAQLSAGFLLTLAFQQTFRDLSDLQRHWYLVLVTLSGVVVALVLTPIAIHRHLAGRHVKGRVVTAGSAMVKVAISALAVLIVGDTAFVYDVVVGGTGAVIAGVGLGLVLVGLLVALPRALVDHG